MNNLVGGSLLILTGICAYAAIHHVFLAFSKPFSKVHFLFSVLCLAIVGFEYLHSLAYAAQTLSEFVPLHKWELAHILFLFAVFPWFIGEYSNRRPRWLLVGLSLLFGLLILANALMPYSIQFVALERLDHIQMPWGETLAQPVGQVGVMFIIGVCGVLTVFGNALYAIGRLYYHNRLRTTLGMLMAIGVLFATGIEGILVRFGVLDFIHLGPYGMLAMIIAMSMALSQEMRNKLHASEHRFRSLVEQSPFSIQVLAPDGTTLQVNSAWERLWGVTLAQISGYNVLQDQQLCDKGVMPYINQGFSGQATEIPPVIYNPAENAVLKGPVCDRWVRAYVYPIKDETEVVREVVLLHEDVTNKKRFDDAIRLIASGVSVDAGDELFGELVRNLSRLFAVSHSFVGVLTAPDSNIIDTVAVCVDGELVENFSYALEGTPCAEVMGQHTCAFAQDVQRRFPNDVLLVEMGAEGYIGTPLFNASGEALGVVVLLDRRPLQNVDQMTVILEIFALRAAAEIERKHANDLLLRNRDQLQTMVDQRTAELQHVVQELEAFSYSVSHDLRAPLRTIDGFSQALAEEYAAALDSVGVDYLRRIRSGVERMSSLIESLLQFSRVAKIDVNRQPVNLSQLVDERLKKFQGQEPLRAVEARVTANVTANGDGDLLSVVIDNLISNAWKYTGKTSQPIIEFGVQQQSSQAVYFVKDNGVGFDMKFVDKLFGAFQRLHSGRDFEGNGIGLATVARIIHRHGGKIWADAKPDSGATFYFTLAGSA